MDKIELLRKNLINTSIGTSAVRNQGNGIAEPIRCKLIEVFTFNSFFDNLKNHDPKEFKRYLNRLTENVDNINGISKNGKEPGRVRWGTARKCVNLFLRTVVYNGFIWDAYNISIRDFQPGGLMEKLELPLDSYVVKGIIKDSKEIDGIGFNSAIYPSFSIINLDRKTESPYYQEKASLIANKTNVCRIDLDLRYWRYKNNC